MPANRLLSISGYLAAFTAAVHTLAGTYEVHSALLSSTLPEELRLLLYACWHLVTVALCLSAWALLKPPKPRTPESEAALARAIGIAWLCFGVVFLGVALLFGQGPAALLALPQWAFLLPVGWLAWSGASKLLATK